MLGAAFGAYRSAPAQLGGTRDLPVRHDPMSRPVPRFQAVQRTRAQRVPLALVLCAVWLLSLVLVWHWASVHAVPELVEVGARLRAAESALQHSARPGAPTRPAPSRLNTFGPDHP